MSVKTVTGELIDEFRSRPTLRAGSLITTVFGDAIAPRGGTVWVGSLIRAMAGFGISERLVRTSVFRLSGDGWLDAHSVGRRSYYGLTRDGARRFEQATRRIYGEPRQRWSGEWCVLLLGGVAPDRREALRKELGWLGFGAIGGSVMAHPSLDEQALDALLDGQGLAGDVVVLTGRSGDDRQDLKLRELAGKSWNLDDIDARYGKFLARFRPAYQAIEHSRSVRPREAFQLRTLLVQEYRKIMLRDPLLPVDLLPEGWKGLSAYQLCRNLYRGLCEPSETYLTEAMETAEGPLPPPGPDFYERFGGLTKAAA